MNLNKWISQNVFYEIKKKKTFGKGRVDHFGYVLQGKV